MVSRKCVWGACDHFRLLISTSRDWFDLQGVGKNLEKMYKELYYRITKILTKFKGRKGNVAII